VFFFFFFFLDLFFIQKFSAFSSSDGYNFYLIFICI